jgi:hypothetical protein
MLLPRPFQQILIDQNWQTLQREEFKLNWQIVDQSYDTPDVKVQLMDITLDLKTKLQKPATSPGGDAIVLQSRDLEADLDIASISVDQYIEREVGGVIGRFRVQAKCENVHLHMNRGKGAFEMKLSPLFEQSLIKSHLDDVTLDWTPDAWSTTAMVCSGAEGFEDVVRAEILKKTGNAAKLTEQKASLMTYVQAYLDTKSVDLAKPRVLLTSRPDIKAILQVEEFLGSDAGARVRGQLQVQFLKSKTRHAIHLKLSSDTIDAANSQNAFLKIPEEFVSVVAEEAFAAGSWSERLSSNQIPGFADLMHSRFNQFFVWPALANYPKEAKFLFDLFSTKNLKVSGSHLNYKIAMSLNAKMYAPEGSKYVPFMNFVVPMSSQVNLSLADGKVAAQFSQADVSIVPEWDESYLRTHQIDKRFGEATLAKRVMKSLEGLQTSYRLPKIPLAESMALRVIKAQRYKKSNDLLIYLR